MNLSPSDLSHALRWIAPDRPVEGGTVYVTPAPAAAAPFRVTWFAPERPVEGQTTYVLPDPRPIRDFTAVGDLLCIDCSGSLIAATTLDFDRIRCACGVTYTLQLLRAVDVELWEVARTERLFFRDGECVLLTTPLEAIREWPGWAGSGF